MKSAALVMVLLFAGVAQGAMQTLGPDTVWANGTTYVADRDRYEFHLADRELVDCPPTHVKGHHFPRRIAFYLKGLQDVTLDFAGAEVFLHGKMQPFLLVDCTNVTVKNVSVRYDRSPYTQGVVRGASDRELRLWIDPVNFPCHVENGRLVYTSETWTEYAPSDSPCFCQFFDGTTRKGAGSALAFFAPNPTIDPSIPWAPGAIQFTVSDEGNGLFVLSSDRSLSSYMGGMRTGNYAVIGHCPRDHSNCELADCRDVTIQNYRIVNGLGMGIFPFHCHNLTLDGVKMFHDETSPSIIANSADGIHAFACSGDFVVTNCVVEGTIDDALNVHGNYYVVESAAGNEIVAYTGLEPEGPTALYRPGDRIAVCRGHTLDRTAEYVITATRVIDDKHVAFTLDVPVAAHTANDIIENLSAQCRLLISNSRFGKSNTHLRLQTRGGVVIEDSETELPFILTGDMNYWYESSPCESLIIRNTRFIGGGAIVSSEPEFTATVANPYYHGDIRVENCVFDNGTPISANGAKSVTVVNCRTSGGAEIKVNAGNCPKVVFNPVEPPPGEPAVQPTSDVPAIDPASVVVTQDPATRAVIVTYTLTGTNAIVTVDFQTNVVGTANWASIGGEHYRRLGGEVNKVVTKLGVPLTIVWHSTREWPGHEVTTEGFRVVVKAWDMRSPPDYMVVDLAGKGAGCRRFYPSAEALPEELATSDFYRTEALVMRRIPAKDVVWRMSSPSGEPGHAAHEATHYVKLTQDYYLAVFETTEYQAMYACGSWAYGDSGARDLPVRSTSYNELRGTVNLWPANGHAVEVSSLIGNFRIRTGIGSFDLPTDAQWEYACRAGTGTRCFFDEVGDSLDDHAWHQGNAGGRVHRVGAKRPNPWGLYDMYGNVLEWCLDWRGSFSSNGGTVAEDPVGDASGSARVKRGGCFEQAAGAAFRSSYRDADVPTWDRYTDGFRLCCEADTTTFEWSE